ncbi:MAG TPA: hypothetical protein VMQ17_23675 [Candidatus Sulfotelmatobacter sp.]|nr:hypothetical protein [Candidatus Sulfotelmatobacter sp.]
MADDCDASSPSEGRKSTSHSEKPSVKPKTSWVLPVITVAVLASAFCVYYFVYVAAQREYLINRNFRSLAVLGDQVQALVSIHGSILEFSADLANRKHEDLKQFVVPRIEDISKEKAEMESEALKDYLKYLAPSFELPEDEETPVKPAKSGSRLKVQRRNGRWELVLAARRHEDSKKERVGRKDYVGSLELSGVLTPLVGSLPFDDILLVSKDGTIVYQSNRAGPQFTTLTDLLQAQPEVATANLPSSAAETKQETKSDESGADTEGPSGKPAERHSPPASGRDEGTGHGAVNRNSDQAWRNKSIHLTDVLLAGTRYKLFLQPVLLDVFNDEATQEEPAQEWVLCGLRSSKTLEWEALSISSTSMVWLTALFLAILMSGPILKILFLNRRERLRLRELGFLALFLVLLTSVFTLSGLNAVGFPLNDDTEQQLQRLGGTLSHNIHQELSQMREQLEQWCSAPDLRDDLKLVESGTSEVIRRRSTAAGIARKTPTANAYHFVNNAFWTNDDGMQIVKWSTSGYLTPMIDLSRLRVYTQPRSTYLDNQAPAFHFDSTLPPNKLEYLAAMIMSTGECSQGLLNSGIREDVRNGSAFLTAEPLSLIDPILPFGYGFALFDQSGLVLFHADKTRNLHENFLQETDWNKQLYAQAFGHSTRSSLTIKYLGHDYQANVLPVTGVSQAPWSLIVYRDLTNVRTLNLQATTMVATLLLAILAVPFLAIVIWCVIRRPGFAPEWVWPNRARMTTYVYLIVTYALLIILFLFLGFTGPSEQNLIACAVIPFTAFFLTVWCIRAYAPRPERVVTPIVEGSRSALANIAMLIALAFLLTAIWRLPYLRAFTFLVFFLGMAALPLLDRPPHSLAIWLKHLYRHTVEEYLSSRPEMDSSVWRRCYLLTILLLLLLVGVLTPLALFRVSLNVERGLSIKRAQLHLASALNQRLMSTIERCKDQPGIDQLGGDACAEFKKTDSPAWRSIVLDPLFPTDGKLPVREHSSNQQRHDLYAGWFHNLIYAFHHDYNQTAAEMLGVLSDRVDSKPDNVSDWFWNNDGSTVTLRWHGVHLPESGNAPPKPGELEHDFVISSSIPPSSGAQILSGATVAVVVIVAIGFIVWALARRIFLFHVAPLKITGALRAAELIREGHNILILVPPVSDWRLEAQKSTLDLREIAATPKWAEEFDLDKVPANALIEILHFEHSWNDPELDNQKSILLQRLEKTENTQLAVIMTVAASSEDYGRMFPTLELVDLREEPFHWLKQYEGPARDFIWKECGPMAALWPIGAQLAEDIRKENIFSEETVVSEILERADGYYRLVWKECSEEQKFVLTQLAEDGLLNPTNGRAIRQLVRQGLITTDPQFRLMNESFCRFLRSAPSVGLKQQWARESRLSGWGKMHGAFLTTMILLGAFLLTTQNALWQSSAAYVTTALGALGTLAKLFNMYRGGATTEKAG